MGISSILKISEAASLALHIAAILAANPKKLITTREFATILQASEAHLSKVLQRLDKGGIVTSKRGPKGGFILKKPNDEITLLDIYEAIDGKLSTTGCLLNKKICDGNCIMGDLVEKLNTLVKDYLSKTRLVDLPNVFENLK